MPVIYTPSWGDHASSWVSVEYWVPTGTSFYDVPISLTAPDSGTHYITFASQGQTDGSYIASLTGWFLGFNSWNDGVDLADYDATGLGDCMTTGYAMLPVMDSPPDVYSDCQTGCTYVKVVVGGEASPSEQIQEILDFVVELKAEKMIDHLTKALGYANADLLQDAWTELYWVLLRTDGRHNPPDLVEGTAASELGEQILNVMKDLSPGWTFEFEADNAFVYSVTTSFDDSRVANALALGALDKFAGKALQWIIWQSFKVPSDPITIVVKAIGLAATALNALNEEYDPIRVLPSAPNIEVEDGVYSAEIPGDDPHYTAIVILDFKGAHWENSMLEHINSDLSLVSHNFLGVTWEEQPVLLSQGDMKTRLTTEKSYIIVPKEMFNVDNIGWWPGSRDVTLRASLMHYADTEADWKLLWLCPK